MTKDVFIITVSAVFRNFNATILYTVPGNDFVYLYSFLLKRLLRECAHNLTNFV